MADVKPEVTTQAAPVDTMEVDKKPEMSESSAPAAADAESSTAAVKKETGVKEEPKEVKVAVFDEPLPKVEGKTEEEVQKLLIGAAKQITFYFSDANLPIDRYLFSLTCCNDPLYGWVPIETLISFSRMRNPYQGLGVDFVAYALKQSIAADGPDPLLGVSEDGKNVRRARTMERDVQGAWARTAYVKGFGEEVDNSQETQTKIMTYLEQFGPLNVVRMRREDQNVEKGNGKSRGKFKGSCFVEFSSVEDTKAFLARETIPKFIPDGPDMLKMTKQEYVDMKTEERKKKGLPVDEPRGRRVGTESTPAPSTNGDAPDEKPQRNGPAFRRPTGNEKFNAFKELERMRKGLPANLASIPDTVAIIGKAVPVAVDTLKRRRDDKDGDDKPKKVARTEPFEIEYNGVMLKCDRETGKVLEPSRVPFEDKSGLKFTGAGEGADWKDFKVQIIKDGGITEPFLAAPPKEKGGRLAKKDGSTFTDAEFDKLHGAKLTYGGVEVVWEWMTRLELQDFWALRASFQGGVAAKKLQAKEDEANQTRLSQAESANKRDFNKHYGNDRGGGRGGGRGGRGGGGRGGGGRGGRGGPRDRERKGGRGGAPAASSGLPPTVGSSAAADAAAGSA